LSHPFAVPTDECERSQGIQNLDEAWKVLAGQTHRDSGAPSILTRTRLLAMQPPSS
jgi:hypothetical protein